MRKPRFVFLFTCALAFSAGVGSHLLSTELNAPLFCLFSGLLILFVGGMASMYKEGLLFMPFILPKAISEALKVSYHSKVSPLNIRLIAFGASLSIGAILGIAVFTT